jgi:hypothetical protein
MARIPIPPNPFPRPMPRPIPVPVRPGPSILPARIVEERAEELRRRGRERPESFERITPFIVVKLFSEDQGARPAQGAAENSISVADAADPSAKPIRLVPGRDYRVQATIWNLGRAPVVFGLAEYYALGHSQLEGFGASLTAKPAGVVDFQIQPGRSTVVRFPQLFRMTDDPDHLRTTFLVQAYDLMQDRVEKPMSYFADRHVARIVRGREG